jgi:hypothetical protein
LSLDVAEVRKFAQEGHGKRRAKTGIQQPDLEAVLRRSGKWPQSWQRSSKREDFAPCHLGHGHFLSASAVQRATQGDRKPWGSLELF